MIKSKPAMYMDEYQDWFQTITGTQITQVDTSPWIYI